MTALANLPFLLFCLGAALGAAGHRISIPTDASSWLGTLLVVLLGLKGGLGLATATSLADVTPALAAGLGCALLVPLLVRPCLKIAGWSAEESALAAGHYGSVSVATFLAMLSYLNSLDIATDEYMIAVMAVMEAPALVVALVLVYRSSSASLQLPSALRVAILNPPLLLLAGAMMVGLVLHQNPAAEPDTRAVLQWIPGLLSVYLLLLGQKAGGLLRRGGVRPPDVVFAVISPLVFGALGLMLGSLLGLSHGNSALLAVLVGSASYIVAPAVLSQVMPHVGLERTQVMVIGVTFPVNLLVAIPLWAALAPAMPRAIF